MESGGGRVGLKEGKEDETCGSGGGGGWRWWRCLWLEVKVKVVEYA